MIKCKVIRSGNVAGEYHNEGDLLELTPRQRDCGLRRGRIEVLEDQSTPTDDKPIKLSEKDVEDQKEDMVEFSKGKKAPAKKAAKKKAKSKSKDTEEDDPLG